MDTPRTLYQRILLCTLAAMAVLFGILTAVSRARPGVYFEESLLAISQDGGRMIYSGTVYGDDVTITAWQEGESRYVTFEREGAAPEHCRVDYTGETIDTDYYYSPMPRVEIWKNDRLLFTGAYNNAEEDTLFPLFEEDGSPRIGVSIRAYTSGDPWSGFSFDEGYILRYAHELSPSCRGSWEGYVVITLLALLSAVWVAFPNRLFYLQHVLSVREPEPTDLYLDIQRISWAVVTGMLLIGYIMALWTITP